MIGRERQQEFLGPSGSLAATVEATRRILFAAGQMRPDEIQRQADAAMPRGAD
jgi:hypothetical protein